MDAVSGFAVYRDQFYLCDRTGGSRYLYALELFRAACDPFADTGTDPVDRLSDFKISQKMERKESGDVFERCLTGDPKLLCTAKVLAYVRRSPDKGRLQISDLRRTEQKV